MTLISHRHKFIFLKSRKTAGSSIEGWLIPQMGPFDIAVTCAENFSTIRHPLGTVSLISKWPRLEMKIKKRLTPFRPALLLDEHSTAPEVRECVGEKIWRSYFKFTVERSPWDRLLSLWSWRRHKLDVEISFDDFLDTIEADPDNPIVEHWSNLKIYSIGGSLAVDETIRFDDLKRGLGGVASRLGLSASLDKMPRHKCGHRDSGTGISSLTQDHITRIADLCRKEIDLFGWPIPES